MTNIEHENLDLAARAAKAVLPFAIVERWNVECRYERSVKLSLNQLLANRYMIAIDSNDITSAEWSVAMHRLGMPTEWQQACFTLLGEASLIFLGYEDDERYGSYKLYLEFCKEIDSPSSKSIV